MNARHYDPGTGRFLSQDTYSGNAYEPWTQHLYSYTGNNPVNYIDPTGHSYIVNETRNGQVGTVANPINSKRIINYRSTGSKKTSTKKSTPIKKVTKAARTVIDFSNGVGAGVAESVTIGASNSLESKWGRENEGVYISGKIVGNGIMAIAGGIGAGAIVTSPTGVGAVAFSGAAVASYSHNVNVLFSMSGDKGAGNKGNVFRGGSKKQRDKWYGKNDKGFQKWWEREGKENGEEMI